MSNIYETALVTGAGSGMGRAIAEMLVGLGMRVVLTGRDQAKLDAVRDGLGDRRDQVRIEPADVADRSAVNDLVQRSLDAFGSLDVLICNAGVNVRERALDVLDPGDWDAMIATNLTGAFNVVHAALPAMRARNKGFIIQVCSIAGRRVGRLAGTGYSASKFAQAALGLGIGLEEHARGIRSTVLYPGEVNTPILDRRPVKVPDERRAAILQPEDVAAAVRFLVELPERASVPELVITPTADDYS